MGHERACLFVTRVPCKRGSSAYTSPVCEISRKVEIGIDRAPLVHLKPRSRSSDGWNGEKKDHDFEQKSIEIDRVRFRPRSRSSDAEGKFGFRVKKRWKLIGNDRVPYLIS